MKRREWMKLILAFTLSLCLVTVVGSLNVNADTSATNTGAGVTGSSVVTPQGDTKSADLNGDGKMDTISAVFVDLDDQIGIAGNCVLKVNDKTITIPGAYFDKKLYIVDINKADRFKEIAISDNGVSSDYVTHFYYFDTDIVEMGSTPGVMAGASDYVEAYNNKSLVDTVEGTKECAVHVTEDGKVIGTPRGKLFQTWIYFGEYKLDGEHKLIAEKKSFYEAIWKNRLTVKKPVTVYGNDKKKVIMKLKKGDKVVFWGSDEKAFTKIKMKNGKFGWIKASTGFSANYFSGLFLAD